MITIADTNPCSTTSVSGVMVAKSATECVIASNKLTITNPFGSSGTFSKNGVSFGFTLSTSGTNPISARDAGSFIISTFAGVTDGSATTYYSIDSTTFTNKFTPTATALTAILSGVSSYVACDSGVTYTFTITP